MAMPKTRSQVTSYLRLLPSQEKRRRCVVIDGADDWWENRLLKDYVARGFTVVSRSRFSKSMAERSFRHVQDNTVASDKLVPWLQQQLQAKLKPRDKDQSVDQPLRIELDKFFLDISLVAEDGTTFHRPLITVAINTQSRTVLKAQVSEGPYLAGSV